RETDLSEKANLAVARKKLAAELEQRLTDLEAKLGSRSSTITSLSDEESEQLAALGYVASDTTELPSEWMDLADMKERFVVKDLNAKLRRRVSAETISPEEHLAISLELVKLSPETPSFHAELGKVYVELGDYANALPAIEHAIDLAPNDAGLHYSFGDALQQMGRSDEARPHIELALEMVPGMAAAHVCMGNILRVEGRLDLATGSYAEAIRIRTKYPEAHYNMAQVFTERGMPDEALKHFQIALEEKPGWVLAHRALANIYLENGDFEGAIVQFEAALEQNESAELRNDYGVALQNLGQPKEALEQYLKAMELAPDFFRPHLNRANMALAYGNDQVALGEFNMAFKLAPSHVETNAKLARFLVSTQVLELRDIQRGIVLAERSVELTGGQSSVAFELLATAYAAAGRFPAALSAASKSQMLARAEGNEALVQALDERITLYALGEPDQTVPSETPPAEIPQTNVPPETGAEEASPPADNE
ncbi:MAG: tetratricopeptide (TPR) repeat protein, partial [Planctomycetota bacterium]